MSNLSFIGDAGFTVINDSGYVQWFMLLLGLVPREGVQGGPFEVHGGSSWGFLMGV